MRPVLLLLLLRRILPERAFRLFSFRLLVDRLRLAVAISSTWALVALQRPEAERILHPSCAWTLSETLHKRHAATSLGLVQLSQPRFWGSTQHILRADRP